MASDRSILLKAVLKALSIAVLSVVGVLFIIVMLLAFPFGKYFNDIGGGFRTSCRNVTGKKLSVEALRLVEGTITDYRFNKNRDAIEFSTKKLSEEALSAYKNYIAETKNCIRNQITNDRCNSYDKTFYNKFEIIHGALQDSWRCNITVNDSTFIMQGKPDYVFDD